jgi:ankyrin repeat protein
MNNSDRTYQAAIGPAGVTTTSFTTTFTSATTNTATNMPLVVRRPTVVAVEEDDEDHIPGPPSKVVVAGQAVPESPMTHTKKTSLSRLFAHGSKALSPSIGKSGKQVQYQATNSFQSQTVSLPPMANLSNNNGSGGLLSKSLGNRKTNATSAILSNSLGNMNPSPTPFTTLGQQQELDLSLTEHRIKGNGILASRADLGLAPEEFAAGCNLLQAAAAGDLARVEVLLNNTPHHVNFRDYDRRTALHVAASEGHLNICQYLVLAKQAKINRSDRWGGSPLDDAHRHRHQDVVLFLRQQGAATGSGSRSTNLITAAAEGDVDEVQMLLTSSNPKIVKVLVDKGDYDKRTPLHLASSEGHVQIVLLLCKAQANVNAEDRWASRPLDDALKAEQQECADVLVKYGAKRSPTLLQRMMTMSENIDSSQARREQDNLKVDFEELAMVDRIGSGAFGEIFKCRWRGTMVAAKCIKSAKIRQDWVNKRALQSIEAGADVDEAMKMMDEAEMDLSDKEEALSDFRQEIAVLKSLRHPHIVLLLAFSTTENYEVMISELMECSLLDVFKAHQVHKTRLAKKSAISYAVQLARGMNYLHTW